MSQADVLDKKTNQFYVNDLETFQINYDKLHGRGGAFLVSPLGQGFVFSREQFSEEYNMF